MALSGLCLCFEFRFSSVTLQLVFGNTFYSELRGSPASLLFWGQYLQDRMICRTRDNWSRYHLVPAVRIRQSSLVPAPAGHVLRPPHVPAPATHVLRTPHIPAPAVHILQPPRIPASAAHVLRTPPVPANATRSCSGGSGGRVVFSPTKVVVLILNHCDRVIQPLSKILTPPVALDLVSQ